MNNVMRDKSMYILHADVCKALAHPLRIEIVDILQQGEMCFSDILEQTGGIKSNLSQHLSMMVSSGILRVRKDSRCNYYKLSSVKVARACSLMREVLADKLRHQHELMRTR